MLLLFIIWFKKFWNGFVNSLVYSQDKKFINHLSQEFKAKNLLNLNPEENDEFLNSFDDVICDCDGVLWNDSGIIPGIDESMKLLSGVGKNIHFLTNNSVKSFEEFRTLFKKVGIEIQPEQLLNPSKIVIRYLNSIDFNKKLFVIGSNNLLSDLKTAGLTCITAANESPENLPWFLENTGDDGDVGAVFVDFDINFNYLKLTKALSLLKRPNVLFLVGTVDNDIPLSNKRKLIGAGPFIKILSEFANREPTLMGKPGRQVKELMMKHFKIKNAKRTLFIGDSMDTDMAFANLCNFQKLLVFTGVSSAQDVIKNKDNTLSPDYTLNTLAELKLLLSKDMKSKS